MQRLFLINLVVLFINYYVCEPYFKMLVVINKMLKGYYYYSSFNLFLKINSKKIKYVLDGLIINTYQLVKVT